MPKEIKKNNMYFTLAALNMFNGSKPFHVGSIVKLIKEFENQYDSEAIRVELRYAGESAYVANSVRSVVKGTMSGRLYDKIAYEDYGIVEFIFDDIIICRVFTPEEVKEELKNPESDINYI